MIPAAENIESKEEAIEIKALEILLSRKNFRSALTKGNLDDRR